MRNFTFKGLFLTAVFMLLGCLSIQAANEELITKQITIKLDKAGTLPDKIASSEMYKITNLKITGEINGTDWKMIREMAGRDYQGYHTKGNLSVLDLSEAKIVEGGDYYYYCNSNSNEMKHLNAQDTVMTGHNKRFYCNLAHNQSKLHRDMYIENVLKKELPKMNKYIEVDL